MGFTDFLFMFVYGIFVILLVYIWSKVREYSSLTRKRMLSGVSLKVFGAILYLLIHDFYFGYGGDSFAYFHDAVLLNDLFMSSPIDYVKYVFGNAELADIWDSMSVQQMYFEKGTKEFNVDVITSLYSWMGFQNYYASTMLVSLGSFLGFWALYRAFIIRYPSLEKWAFVAVFCIPSSIVWASAIVKENYILMAMGVIFLNLYYIIVEKDRVFGRVVLILFMLYLVSLIKIYVLMALVPALFLQYVFGLLRNSNNLVLKRIVRPLMLIGVFSLTFYFANLISQQVELLSFDNFIGKAKSMQEWHYKEGANTSEQHGRGSSYTLGEYDSSILGTMKMIPTSINVTFFRPYIWEVNSPLMALVAAESLMFLLIVLYIMFQRNIYKHFNEIFADPFLVMMIFFSLIFGFLVGFTSYNFGALDRYKLPTMPVFSFAIAIVINRIKELKKTGRITI